jgi:hypothetical protein
MTSRRIGFQPVGFAIDRLEAYPTVIWLAAATQTLLELAYDLMNR